MKACACAEICLHCQICWAQGHRHPEYASPGGLGSHVASHRGKPPQARANPQRALNRGERIYIRKRIEHAALTLAAELHLDPRLVLHAIPAIIKAAREREVRVDPDDIPLTGPAVVLGMAHLRPL